MIFSGKKAQKREREKLSRPEEKGKEVTYLFQNLMALQTVEAQLKVAVETN